MDINITCMFTLNSVQVEEFLIEDPAFQVCETASVK